MRVAVRMVIVSAFFVSVTVAVQALWSRLTGSSWSLWESVVLGICLGAVEEFLWYCERRGWLTFGPPARSDRIKQRKEELARERDEILADALARKEALDHGE